jgi:hypothetical protein
MVARWQAVTSEQTPPPALACERIDLSSRDDRALFLTVTGGWLEGD